MAKNGKKGGGAKTKKTARKKKPAAGTKPRGRPARKKPESGPGEEPFWLKRQRRLRQEQRRPNGDPPPSDPGLSTTMADPKDRMLRYRGPVCPRCGSKPVVCEMKRGAYARYRCRVRECRHRWEVS